jgi:hypothetical protein
MYNAVTLQVVNQRMGYGRIVVAVIQGAGAGKEINELFAMLIEQMGAFGCIKYSRKGTDIAPDLRFQFFKYAHDVVSCG